MRRLLLILSMTAFACVQVVITPTVAPSPLPSPTVTVSLPQATATIPPSETEWIGVVRQPVVNVRQTPGGAVIGALNAGDRVTIIQCLNEWCQIDPAGWVWRGCLEGAASSLGCEADK